MKTNNKYREALEKILAIAKDEFEDIYNAGRIEDLCRQALAEPLRNCEVGTVQEQEERFNAFCSSHFSCEWNCKGCPAHTTGRCSLAWMQMPYEGGVK